MLQFKRRDCSSAIAPPQAAAATTTTDNSKPREQELEEDNDEEEDKALAREQIKRMMNRMQEMQRKHQERQQQLSASNPIGESSGATNFERRLQTTTSTPSAVQQNRRQDSLMIRNDEDPAAKETASHELIKRRFFEKLERRKSIIGNSTTPMTLMNPPTTTTPTLMMRRNFTSKLSNLSEEENECAYGFCWSSAANCEIVVDEHQTNGSNKADYLNNNQLFVCDSTPEASSGESKADASALCERENDKALTIGGGGGGSGGGSPHQVDEKEEAVYLTLDWKNVQVNESSPSPANESNDNKEQSSGETAARNARCWSSAVEQKQIKPKLPNENNKPPQAEPFNAAAAAADMHSEYKHPVPAGQQQQVSCCPERKPRAETQVLAAGCARRVDQADLVILPKKSVNMMNTIGGNSEPQLLQPASLRRNSSARRALVRPPSREPRLTHLGRRADSPGLSSSLSSLASSCSSSSGLTSSPSSSSSHSSSSSSVRSLATDERVPAIQRLEQLSLSEDDLKSLISHANCCSRARRRPTASKSSGRAARGHEDPNKKDDSSNSSSGNSSATRSLMNSLFHRRQTGGGGNGRGKTQPSSSDSHATSAKSVPNLIVGSHSIISSRSRATGGRTNAAPAEQNRKASDGFWSLFAGSIGPSHANTSPLEQPKQQQQQQQRRRLEREKQTSDGRDSGSSNIYSSPLWQPKTAGYQLHLPVADSPQPLKLARPHPHPQQQATYATLTSSKYHSCARHGQHRRHHQRQHHHHHHHRHHQHHRHRHERDRDYRDRSSSRHAHLLVGGAGRSCGRSVATAADNDGGGAQPVWGQLIEINKLDGSQVVELERRAGESWGFFVARGAINRTKGIFISRMQDSAHDRTTTVAAAAAAKLTTSPLTGLLGVGDRLLAIDEHQIGPDYDILRVNRLIGKKNKIWLKVKPFKG